MTYPPSPNFAGHRLEPIEGEPDFLLRISQTPGAYGTVNGKDWFCTTPNGLFGNISNHEVKINPNGTITVAPSILVSGGADGKSYHGYLINGVWREC